MTRLSTKSRSGLLVVEELEQNVTVAVYVSSCFENCDVTDKNQMLKILVQQLFFSNFHDVYRWLHCPPWVRKIQLVS